MKRYRGSGNYNSYSGPNVAKRRRNIEHSYKGYYNLAFSESFSRLTDRDIELRQEYAKDLIARYLNMHKKFIKFRKKSTEQGDINLDEVFYVRVGKQPIGKVSMRVTRLGSKSNLFISYQEKSNYHTPRRRSPNSNSRRQVKRTAKRNNRTRRKKNKKTF